MIKLSSTGLEALDKALGGGLASGSVVYISADAATNCEVILFHFTQPRKTIYFTTTREPKYIIQDMEFLGFDISNIEFIDIFSVSRLDYNLLEFVGEKLKEIKDRDITIIIDSFHILSLSNANRNSIVELMHRIYNTAKENNAVIYLFSLKNTMDSKIENELIGYCDVVFNVGSLRYKEIISNELLITKARNIQVSDNIIRFFIKGKVVGDPSELIA